MKSAKRFLKSASFAGRGLVKVWREEPNFRWEVLMAILVIILASLLKVGLLAMALLVITCILVIALEILNTMVEIMSDVLRPRLNDYIKHVKDLTAAAVSIAALGAIIIGLLILLPPLIKLLWQ